ncbi:MAG: LacI family DNA-binding transcriptional regulator [Jatrophihabitans sp.]
MATRQLGSARSGRVRIGDVADAAGVSVATVSKSLNGRTDVSEGTRLRVQQVAERLGFRPNQLARSLPIGRSFSVGLLTTDSFGRFSIPLMLGAEDALGPGEVAIVFCDTRDDPDREARQIHALLSRHVDGIIVNGRRTEPRPPLTDAPGVPVVYAFSPSADPTDCSVVADEAGGTALAVGHLLEQGRRRIAHVTGPRRHRSAAVRAQATRDELRARGLAIRGGVAFGQWSENWGRIAMTRLLDRAPDIDGVFCGSDQIARGVLDALRERGRIVPGDVGVVGFDNWEAMALGARPALTTIDMDLGEIGRVAAQHLLTAIDGGQPPRRTAVAPRLVVRESS